MLGTCSAPREGTWKAGRESHVTGSNVTTESAVLTATKQSLYAKHWIPLHSLHPPNYEKHLLPLNSKSSYFIVIFIGVRRLLSCPNLCIAPEVKNYVQKMHFRIVNNKTQNNLASS